MNMDKMGKLALVIILLGVLSGTTFVYADERGNKDKDKKEKSSSKIMEKIDKLENRLDSSTSKIREKIERLESRLSSSTTSTSTLPRKNHDDDDDDDGDDDDEDDDHDNRSGRSDDANSLGKQKQLQNLLNLLFRKFGIRIDVGTTTADTLAPNISDISVVKGTNTAAISWRTNEFARGEVRYGTSTPITASSTTVRVGTFSLEHTVNLGNLIPDTIYNYVIVAKDASGNVRENQLLTFRTGAIPSADTSAPNIVFATNIALKATSTRIIWVTDEAADSRVWVSTTTPVNMNGPANASSTSLSLFHSFEITGLTASTTYFYSIGSKDASGNESTLNGNSFQTPAN